MLDGVIIGGIALALIGLFHPIVIWSEYHFSSRCWPAFLLAGLALLAASLFVRQTIPSAALGVAGMSCLWSILELKEQEKQQQTTENEGSGSNESSAVNESFTDNSDSSMDSLLSQVKTLLPQDNGTWSVYVCNLLKDSNGVINNTPMQAASLIKLYIMGAVYDNYDAISQSHGGDTVDSNISSMITVSDNDAANTLVNWLGNGDSSAGMQKVNEFCQKYGFNDTQMNRLLLADNSNGDNYTSVKDCGIFLKKIYQISKGIIDSSSLPNAEAMYYHLKMQQRKNKIPADLPEGVQTANKTGELDTVENDAAIIYDTAKGIDLVICFMSQDLTDTGAAQTAIAQDARAIYGYYNE